MHPESKKYLWDATEAGRLALQFAAGKTLVDYLSEALLRAAIERQLIILGEALSRLRQVDPGAAAGIVDLHRAVALRNVLVHAYAEADDQLVWSVIVGPLPQLLAQIELL